MNRAEFLARIRARHPEHAVSDDPANADAVKIPMQLVPELFQWLRDDPETAMDYLEFETCADYPPEKLDLVYYLYSLTKRHRLALKIELPREQPAVPTISHLWTNADWNEREIYDLFGVHFEGHPDLRRLMMPEDWEGHPLRKDYAHPNVVPRPD
ncbi:MAG: NADH-quinone oxidoreductase subunit C [Armatimonadetes bacterium]|nr:NADH-quinone oxidoreductase subunit C [Armatimonadota bacterium]